MPLGSHPRYSLRSRSTSRAIRACLNPGVYFELPRGTPASEFIYFDIDVVHLKHSGANGGEARFPRFGGISQAALGQSLVNEGAYSPLGCRIEPQIFHSLWGGKKYSTLDPSDLWFPSTRRHIQ